MLRNDAAQSHPHPSSLHIAPLMLSHARELVTWRYPPPYDVYNAGANADLDDIAQAYLNPAYHYHAVLNAENVLLGFRCFGEDARVPGGDYTADALDMGGGLRPDMTGRGLGQVVMQLAIDFAQERWNPPAFRVTVAAWNTRAQRACARVGYHEVSRFISPYDTEFLILLRAGSAVPVAL